MHLGLYRELLRGPARQPGAIAVGALLGGVLLWEIALRSQMGVAIGFLEEIWSRNLGHVFVSPLRPWELVAALIVMSVHADLGRGHAGGCCWRGFSMRSICSAWAGAGAVRRQPDGDGLGVSLGVVSLILRHGAGAEALAWSVLFGLTPFSAVFYPVSVLPRALQPVALALPSAHVFEGMRTALSTGAVAWGHLAWAAGLNLAWLAAAGAVFAAQFRAARVRGALISIGE